MEPIAAGLGVSFVPDDSDFSMGMGMGMSMGGDGDGDDAGGPGVRSGLRPRDPPRGAAAGSQDVIMGSASRGDGRGGGGAAGDADDAGELSFSFAELSIDELESGSSGLLAGATVMPVVAQAPPSAVRPSTASKLSTGARRLIGSDL